jgi:hypothetical protein
MTTVSGTTSVCIDGVNTSRPSTADKTEIAGVNMPSPNSMAAPKRPMPRRTRLVPTGERCRLRRVMSANMPPSPSLSARRTTVTYFKVTESVSAQTTSESRPSTSATEGCDVPSAPSAVLKA